MAKIKLILVKSTEEVLEEFEQGTNLDYILVRLNKHRDNLETKNTKIQIKLINGIVKNGKRK